MFGKVKEAKFDCVVQIPSPEHVKQMRGLIAGLREDQSKRLARMAKKVSEFQQQHHQFPILSTSNTYVSHEWNRVFESIQEGDVFKAIDSLKQIPKTDVILSALLATHSLEHLDNVMKGSILAIMHKGLYSLNHDLSFTPHTFELLIKDIASTIMNPGKIHISFGLPSHHAYRHEARGFCFFNKTALLLHHKAQTTQQPLRFVIIGTDVNRDDGLCQILRETATHLTICHVDVFDSRVYPGMDKSYIDQEFNQSPTVLPQNIMCWQKNRFQYFAVDLSLTPRKANECHPALHFALNQLTQSILQAKANNEKVYILLPTGWDSHEMELAACGKLIGPRFLSNKESHLCRFNSHDLKYFYQHLFSLYVENKEAIEGIYWGLEGGYTPKVYEEQIELMLSTMMETLAPTLQSHKMYR
jgi:acetoin utilization deacetylase AcuC-like enzyme